MDYQIMTDSCCDLPLAVVEEYGLDIINFTINIGGKDLVDDMGKEFDKQSFFQRLKDGETASTSQVNVHAYIEKFKEYVDKKIPVVFLSFSSGLSGSYNNAVQAKEMLKEEYDSVDLSIIDTKGASLGEGLLVYEAAKRKNEGYDKEALIEWVENNKLNYQSWVTVDDIKHLQRGGRISATAATFGSLLSVKPIIVMNQEGKLIPVAKIRGRKKSIQHLIDQTVNSLKDVEEHAIFIGHVGVPQEAELIRQQLLEKVKPSECVVSSYGPTVASHTGFGSLAIFSYGQKRQN